MAGPGRSCPLAYRYRPEDLAGPPELRCSTLYVVGGLYGNTAALDAVLDRAAAEPGPVEIVFNGDFHYLDADPDTFATITAGVRRHRATLGNVEFALTADAEQVGCGCDYPDHIPETVVADSNAVVERLRTVAAAFPEHLAELAGLPRHLTVAVGGHRIAVVHGDLESLAGWRLALDAMEPADHDARARTGWTGTPTDTATLDDWFTRAEVDVICCTHTGLPYAQTHDRDGRARLVANNGSAGLPNFTDGRYGVLTRLSTDPAPAPDSVYGHDLDTLRFDAVPIHYDHPRWLSEFLHTWPPGTPAHRAYHPRITEGTWLTVDRAVRATTDTRS